MRYIVLFPVDEDTWAKEEFFCKNDLTNWATQHPREMKGAVVYEVSRIVGVIVRTTVQIL